MEIAEEFNDYTTEKLYFENELIEFRVFAKMKDWTAGSLISYLSDVHCIESMEKKKSHCECGKTHCICELELSITS